MTLRLGFVGTGKWGRKLAESFRACGAEVVAHDSRTSAWRHSVHKDPRRCDCGHLYEQHIRGHDLVAAQGCHGFGRWIPDGSNEGGSLVNTNTCDAKCQRFVRTPLPEGFGRYMPWRDQLADKNIDAIVAVAPPEVTTEVALACAEAGKAVMATKPLFDHPATIRAPFYVDFWRLWSEAQWKVKAMPSLYLRRGVTLVGCGPIRAFPGAFDYGPHVMAAALDAGVPLGGALAHIGKDEALADANNGGETFVLNVKSENYETIPLRFGNGCAESIRTIWGDAETPLAIGDEPRADIMKNFAQAFLNDVTEGYADSRLLNYSRESMRLLRQIREMAK
jgi:hypothetical protein